MTRETSIVPLANGAMMYLQDGGKPVITLTFASAKDAEIVSRVWTDSEPTVIPITQPTLECAGRFDGPVTDKTKCLYCGKKWIQH